MIIREATISDSYAVAKVHVDSCNTTYKEIIPEEFLKDRTYKGQEKKWLDRLFNNSNTKEFMFVAENEDGELVGFAAASHESEDDRFQGILYTLYILEDYQRKGIGIMLVSAVVRRLMDLGIKSMMVWVLAENSSRKFYEYLGGKAVKEQMINKGKDLLEIAYGWDNIEIILDKLK